MSRYMLNICVLYECNMSKEDTAFVLSGKKPLGGVNVFNRMVDRYILGGSPQMGISNDRKLPVDQNIPEICDPYGARSSLTRTFVTNLLVHIRQKAKIAFKKSFKRAAF